MEHLRTLFYTASFVCSTITLSACGGSTQASSSSGTIAPTPHGTQISPTEFSAYMDSGTWLREATVNLQEGKFTSVSTSTINILNSAEISLNNCDTEEPIIGSAQDVLIDKAEQQEFCSFFANGSTHSAEYYLDDNGSLTELSFCDDTLLTTGTLAKISDATEFNLGTLTDNAYFPTEGEPRNNKVCGDISTIEILEPSIDDFNTTSLSIKSTFTQDEVELTEIFTFTFPTNAPIGTYIAVDELTDSLAQEVVVKFSTSEDLSDSPDPDFLDKEFAVGTLEITNISKYQVEGSYSINMNDEDGGFGIGVEFDHIFSINLKP